MADWDKGRIAVSLSLPDYITTVRGINVDLPNSVNINTNQPWNKLHHFGKDGFNYGVERKIPSYTFTIEVPTLSESCAYLRAVKESKVYVDIEVKDASIDGSITTSLAAEHKTLYDRLKRCKITDESFTVSPANVVMVRFTGFGLSYETAKPSTDGNTKSLVYGKGSPVINLNNYNKMKADNRCDASNSLSKIWPTSTTPP